jgi:hypothetical protein
MTGMTDLLYLACMILLPIVPAYLLFKALGSTGDVSGPLMGLKIKLGGAFAGYFAVLVLLFVMYHVWHPTYQVWKVHGVVQDEHGIPFQTLDRSNVTLQPADLTLFPDGTFDMQFAAVPGDWPTLVINYPNYQAVTVLLDPGASDMKDDGNGTLTINNPIKLQSMGQYTGAGVVATPVAATPEQKP